MRIPLALRLAVFVGCYCSFALSSSADDAGLSLQTGQKVVFLGDSNTAFGWEYPTGYVHLISQALAIQGRQIEVIPAGVKGDTSKSILARLDADVLGKKPDWVILSCGLDDVWYGANGVPLDQYKLNVTSIIDKLTAAGIKVVILTSTMIGEDPTGSNNQTLETYNGFLRSLALEKKLPMADLYADMVNDITKSHTSNPNSAGNLLTIDGVHMNGMGSEIMASGVLKTLGCSDTDLARAEAAWDELPNAMELLPVKLTLHQYEQMQALAALRGCSVDKLVNDTFTTSMDGLLSTNNAPAAPQAPKAGPEW
jgi:lysophospholipase L1-like esterase